VYPLYTDIGSLMTRKANFALVDPLSPTPPWCDPRYHRPEMSPTPTTAITAMIAYSDLLSPEWPRDESKYVCPPGTIIQAHPCPQVPLRLIKSAPGIDPRKTETPLTLHRRTGKRPVYAPETNRPVTRSHLALTEARVIEEYQPKWTYEG